MLKFRDLDYDGDTIIEVMVVLAILGLAISILFATANRSLLNTRQAQENTIATTLVQSQIEALRNMTGNPTTSPNNIFIPNSPYCINTTNPRSFSVVQPDTDPICSPANSPYHLSITYSSTDSTFKVVATWPDILNQGTDTVTMYYRLHPGAVPGNSPNTGGNVCPNAPNQPWNGNDFTNGWIATGSPPFFTDTQNRVTYPGGQHGPIYVAQKDNPRGGMAGVPLGNLVVCIPPLQSGNGCTAVGGPGSCGSGFQPPSIYFTGVAVPLDGTDMANAQTVDMYWQDSCSQTSPNTLCFPLVVPLYQGVSQFQMLDASKSSQNLWAVWICSAKVFYQHAPVIDYYDDPGGDVNCSPTPNSKNPSLHSYTHGWNNGTNYWSNYVIVDTCYYPGDSRCGGVVTGPVGK